MFKKKNKKGISPLIATVLIIGFTIVIAALVITWGTNLFKKTQERTGEVSDINLACTEVLGSLGLTATNIDEDAGTLSLTVDNSAARDIDGFVVRVYNTSETSAVTLDTENEDVGITPAEFNVAGNNLKTFVIDYNESVVTNPVKIGFRPKVVVSGVPQQCAGEASKEL